MGDNQCVGAFQPFSYDDTEDGVVMYDMVLGMAFLRNAYLLIDFGSLSTGHLLAPMPRTYNCCQSLMLLMPLRISHECAWTMAQMSMTSLRWPHILHDHHHDHHDHKIKRQVATMGDWYYFRRCYSVLLLGICIYYCCRRRRLQRVSSTQATWVPYAPQSYRPLYDPSPQGAYDMHLAPNANPVHVPEYRSAWDAHY
ncbi:hypothetical protein C8R48DRAFT_744123 [Suillus tomentosus]|nr:hypothetical protein C8R48DRAFT_744123 [Suillus tomentosus]